MHQKLINYVIADDIQQFKIITSNEDSFAQAIKSFKFPMYISDGAMTELNFFQFLMLHGSYEMQLHFVEYCKDSSTYVKKLERFIIKALRSKFMSLIANKMLKSYASLYDEDYIFESIFYYGFKELSSQASLEYFENFRDCLNSLNREKPSLKEKFTKGLNIFIEDNKLKKEFSTQEYIKSFFEIFKDYIDCKELLLNIPVGGYISHNRFREKALEVLRTKSDQEKYLFCESYLKVLEINDLLLIEICALIINNSHLKNQLNKIFQRKITDYLTDDLVELELKRKNIGILKQVLSMIFFEYSECKSLLENIQWCYAKVRISFFNPEIFDPLTNCFDQVDKTGSLSKALHIWMESKYPDILFRDEIMQKENNNSQESAKQKSKKRKRTEELDFRADVQVDSKAKRAKQTITPSLIKRATDFAEYAVAERAFEKASFLSLKSQSQQNIDLLKSEIISYIKGRTQVQVESKPQNFFGVLKYHKELSNIFCEIISRDLFVYHFSNIAIKDSLLSHDMLRKKGIEFDGFTNEDDKNTGNTGYVFTCTSFCFDGVATSFNIQSFLNSDTKLMYQTQLSRIKSMPWAVLTMQDWAMYNDRTVYTAKICDSLITKLRFNKEDNPVFKREKVIEIKDGFGLQKNLVIPRNQEIFYGRNISLGLALSAIRILTALGEKAIKDLHSNLSVVNISNFIATYMPLELKIPNEISVEICSIRERNVESWSDLGVTPFNK